MYQWGLALIITGLLCAQPSTTTNDIADLVLWRSVREATDPAAVARYLQSFPQGLFRVAATERLAALANNDRPRSADATPRFTAHHVHTWGTPCFGDLAITSEGMTYDGLHPMTFLKTGVQSVAPCTGKGALSGSICIISLERKRTIFLLDAPPQTFADALQRVWHGSTR
jgi:hypothetical protein